MLIPKPGASAAKAANHFVYHQQNVIFFADFLHAWPVTFGGHNNAAPCCDRLKDQPANGVRTFAQDDIFNRICGAQSVAFALSQIVLGRFAIFKAMRHGNETFGEGAILRAALMLATGSQCRNGGAMIIALAVQDFILLAAIFLMRNLSDHFEAFFIGFRSRI